MSTNTVQDDGAPFGAGLALLLTAVGAVFAICCAAVTKDVGFRVAAMIFATAFTTAAFVLAALIADDKLRIDPLKYADGVIKAGVIATMFWGIAGMLVGLTHRRPAVLAEPLLLPATSGS